MSQDVKMTEEDKLKINSENLTTNATFSFHGEDHTLGNLMRMILIKDPDVEFCGYSVPHPSEEIMNVRVQTFKTPTDKVVIKGLNTISKMCDILGEKFEQAINSFKNQTDQIIEDDT